MTKGVWRLYICLRLYYLANYNKTDMSEGRFKNIYCIPSARAAWHDYNRGTYFITICTHAREQYFGEIRYDENGEAIMNMSEIGKHAEECWRAIPQHFPHIQAPLWIIMPNHVHGIVIIDPLVETQNFASLQTRPNDKQKQIWTSIQKFGICNSWIQNCCHQIRP